MSVHRTEDRKQREQEQAVSAAVQKPAVETELVTPAPASGKADGWEQLRRRPQSDSGKAKTDDLELSDADTSEASRVNW